MSSGDPPAPRPPLPLQLLDRLFEFCASVKLAILVILGIAFFLASSTFYEARYGTSAVQEVVYGSWGFMLVMAMLAINVMAAVIWRYPWKRKQTGFIITHIGIEVLLLGCLISYRQSIDGHVALREGDSRSAIELNSEQVGIAFAHGKSASNGGRAVSINVWRQAGYPGLARFVAGLVSPLPENPRWPAGRKETYKVEEGVQLEVVDWLPSARLEREYLPDPNGFPAAQVHLAGSTPAGAKVDQQLWLYADNPDGAIESFFNGAIELTFWRSRQPSEMEEFLHPPKVADLPPAGQLAVVVAGVTFRIPVDGNIGKAIPLGGKGLTATITEYLPSAERRKGQLVKSSDEPKDPILKVKLAGPAGLQEHVVSARYPFLRTRNEDLTVGHGAAGFHGGPRPGVEAAGESEPLLLFHHPAVYGPVKEGMAAATRGRLQLIQSGDGKLYGRLFALQGLRDAFEVQPGKEYPGWMGMTFAISQHLPSALLHEEYKPFNASAKAMAASSMRAIKVALIVDGERTAETWLERSAEGKVVPTSRGAARVAYNFDSYAIPFQVKLRSVEKKTDPGSAAAAAFHSELTIDPTGASKPSVTGDHSISMNEPLTVDGFKIFQSSFDDSRDPIKVSFLGMRKDPGMPLKYVGCLLMIGGIFTMFYMKAYFQKPAGVKPAARAAVADPRARPEPTKRAKKSRSKAAVR